MADNFDKFAITFICGMIGIILAYVFYWMNLNEIIINEYVTGSITIEKIMAVSIIIWTMIGVVLSSFN